MIDILVGEINFKDVKDKGVSRYTWDNLIRLGYLEKTSTAFKLGKELPDEKELKLEIAISNYNNRYPNKVRNRGVSLEDMDEWLSILFMQDGLFPIHKLFKVMEVKNTRYLMAVLIEMEYIKSRNKTGTEILVTEYDLDEVYNRYKKAVKGHSEKYRKTKTKYNSIYL